MIAYGVSVAASTLVGNSLGALNVILAKAYAKMILSSFVVINIILTLTVYFFRWQIASAYIA